MIDSADDAPLLGVIASPERVEVALVERTPFGRLRSGGRRLVEDVDGPSRFLPLDVPRQLAGIPVRGEETTAAEAWVGSIANAIGKLTFGLRGGAVRLGVALDARLDGRGRRVLAARGGPRVDDIVEALVTALRGRQIRVVGPLGRVVTLARAAAQGEVRSALGGLAGGIDGVVLHWDREIGWVDVARGEVVRESQELPGSRLDLGLAQLDARSVRGGQPSGRSATLARRGDREARAAFAEAAQSLGEAAARRLLARWAERGAPGEARGPTRVVLAGTCGRFGLDPRLEACTRLPFERGLANGLANREDAAMEAGLLEVDGSEVRLADGVAHVGKDDSACLLGAAATALEAELPAEERPRGEEGSTGREGSQ